MAKQTVAERVHEQMHQIPGVPVHSEAEKLNHRGGQPNQPMQNQPLQNRPLKTGSLKNRPLKNRHQHGEPKVLVGWQNAIGRFFSREDK